MRKIKYLLYLLLVGLIFILAACSSSPPKGEGDFTFATNLNGKNAITEFENQKESEYLLFLYLDRCPYCHEMAKVLDQYTKTPNALPIYAVEGEQEGGRDVFSFFKVEKVPVLVHMKDVNGRKVEIGRIVGAGASVEEIQKFVEQK